MPDPLSERARALFRGTPRAGHGGPGWLSGHAREPLSETEVHWHWRVEGGRIVAARYAVRGCPHVIAAAALAAERLEGQPATAPSLDMGAIAREIEAPREKLGRLFVVEDAMRATALEAARE